MSRRPVNKTDEIAALSDPYDNKKHLKAAIVKVLPDGTGDLVSAELGKFLLNPESWEVSKSVNWAAKTIPGQSDPVLQFVAGGPRTVSFQALVTKETSHEPFINSKTDVLGQVLDAAISAASAVASAFANVPVPPLGDFGGVDSSSGNDLSIDKKLRFYESLCYPEYAEGVLIQSPPLVLLYVGASLATLAQTPAPGEAIDTKTSLWVILNMDYTITKQLPNLNPMEAIVEFKLMQYIIVSRGAKAFSLSGKPTGQLESTNKLGLFEE